MLLLPVVRGSSQRRRVIVSDTPARGGFDRDEMVVRRASLASRPRICHAPAVRNRGLLILLVAALAAPAADAHVGGTPWPVAKAMRAVDGARMRVGSKVIRVDAETALCSGEGRAATRRGVRTWRHFRCTFTTFTTRGPGRDVEFRLHALDSRRFQLSDARWIG
jgi:hypothetical protein